MLSIWGVIIITLLLTLLAERVKNKSLKYRGNIVESTNVINLFYAFPIMVLVFYSGLRSSIGDTGYYMYSYNNLPINFLDIFSQRDWGFVLYQSIIKLLFPHPQIFLIITSLITLSLILLTLRKYSPYLMFSVFIFFVEGFYIASMNGMRQFLVAALLFYASPLIFQREKMKFLIIVLLVSTLHNSALIMLPIYFMVNRKAWTMSTFSNLFLTAVVFLGFDIFFNMISPLVEATQYSNYIEGMMTDTGQGANILRALVAFIPVFLSYEFREQLRLKLKNYDVYANFALLNFIIITFASYNWIFARISLYFGLYNLILLPAIFYYCFDKKFKILIQYLAICFYLVYFYFDIQPHIYASYFLDINRNLIGPLTRTFYN